MRWRSSNLYLFKAKPQPPFRPWKHPTPKDQLKLVLEAKKGDRLLSSAGRNFAFWDVPKRRDGLGMEIVTQIWNWAITNQTCTYCKSKEHETKDFLTNIVFLFWPLSHSLSSIQAQSSVNGYIGTRRWLREKQVRNRNHKAEKMEERDHGYDCERQGEKMGRWV